MRILLVEDEKELSRALAQMLMKDGYDVDCVYDGADGLNFASTGMYDIVLLDMMMPKLNGFEVLAKLRARKLETPVIMLTALTDERDKIEGLDKGADDYVSKPFSFNELSARIRAVLRRRGKLLSDNKLEYRNASLDLTTFTLSTNKASINLTGKEFELLRYLLNIPTLLRQRKISFSKHGGSTASSSPTTLKCTCPSCARNSPISTPISQSNPCAEWAIA